MKVSSFKKLITATAIPLAFALSSVNAAAEPLKIGYSDWPGFVAFQVAIDKGWFKEAGVDVKFEWFDYSASMDAYTAGKLDAVMVTNGDALVVGSGGAKNVMVLITDYSNGNDMIIGKPGIKTLADLKGKKIGLETGFVEHLMLLNALEKAGMKESDVAIVNTKTNETPQALASGQLAAIAAWQPNSGQAMKLVPGAKPIYTSAQAPGLIYDVIAATPGSISTHKAEWAKVLKVWDKTVAYINDPKTQPDALKIMSQKVGLKPEAYKPLLKGTKLLNVAEGKAAYVKADGFKSLYGSSKIADDFNVKYGVYKTAQDLGKAIDPVLYQ
ncbi:MAG: ABC transporter substrate-binding protein [Methylophilales bacterium]|nr:ABC transporter substrate-binding protein [Methylophilales bacterium]